MKKLFLCFLLFIHFLVTSAQGKEPLKITPSPFKSENALEVLPSGAIAYAKLGQMEKLLTDIDLLITPFVPQELLPPPVKPFFKESQAIIRLATAQSFGQPLFANQLLTNLGIKTDGNIYAALYPQGQGSKSPNFILSIPISNTAAITPLLLGALAVQDYQKLDFGDFIAWEVISFHKELPPKLYIICSSNNLYLTNSQNYIQALIRTDKEHSLSKSVLAKYLSNSESDFVAIVDFNPVKPFYAYFQPKIKTLHLELIKEINKSISQIPPHQKANINFRLQTQFNLVSIDQMMTYLEATILAIAPHLYAELDAFITNSHGFGFNLDLDQEFQSIEFQAFSDSLKKPTTVIDIKRVIELAKLLPGDKSNLYAKSREDKTDFKKALEPYLISLKEEYQKKGLDIKILDNFSKYITSQMETHSFSDITPLVVSTNHTTDAIVAPNENKTFSEFLAEFKNFTPLGDQTTTIMTDTTAEQVMGFYAKEIKNFQSSATTIDSLAQAFSFSEDQYTKIAKVNKNNLENNITQLTIEKGISIKKGYFGYSEHDLINRQLVFFKPFGKDIILEDGRCHLDSFQETKAVGLAESVIKLLQRAPKNTTEISTNRILHQLPTAIAILEDIENTIHKECNEYITKVKAAKVNATNVPNSLQGINTPLLLSSISQNSSEQLQFKLLGVLDFPRNKVIPYIKALVTDVPNFKDSHGGSACYITKNDGYYSTKLTFSSTGLAKLVSSVANHFHLNHNQTPDGMQKLLQEIVAPGDGKINHNETIFTNPYWESIITLLQIP